jgi:molecular chaperone GrpE
MSDEIDIPVKVVDRRRWRENGDANPAAMPQASLKPTYVEELEQRLAQAEQQAQEYLGKYRQAAHEFEDARARMRKELAKDAERNRRDVLAGFLDILDNLDRAIDAAQKSSRLHSAPADEGGSDPLLHGVEMVRQQFLSKLEGFQVTRVASDGTAFDPLLHEAVTTVPAVDPAQDGTIVGTVRHGYRIGDEVLRPALVAVAKSV